MKVIKAFATWCNPCKSLAPKLETVMEEFPNVEFEELDVDKDGVRAGQLGIMSVPTVAILHEGEVVVARFNGDKPEEFIRTFIEDNLK